MFTSPFQLISIMLFAKIIYIIFFFLYSLTYTLSIAKSKILSRLLFTFLLICFSITFTSPFQLITIILFVSIICIIFFFLSSLLTYTLSITNIKNLSTLIFIFLLVFCSITFIYLFQLIALAFFLNTAVT